MKTIPIVSHENKSLCTACGGNCCRTMPGFLAPRDITPSLDEGQMLVDIHRLIQTGKYAIAMREFDTFDGWETLRYIMPKTELMRGNTIFPVANWGRCVFHTDEGCVFEEAKRPFECRALIPNKDNTKCRASTDINLDAELQEWRKYQDVISVVEDLYYETIPVQRMK